MQTGLVPFTNCGIKKNEGDNKQKYFLLQVWCKMLYYTWDDVSINRQCNRAKKF